MTKKLPLSLAFLAISSVSFAQSIDFSAFNLPKSQVDLYLIASPSSVGLGSTGNNQTWDYSNAVKISSDSIIYYSAQDSTTGYPDVHTFVYRDLVSPTGASIDGYVYYNVNQRGFYSAAFYTAAFSESLAAFTGNANDALVIPSQRLTFADSVFALKFPVNTNSAWTSSQDRIVNFNLSLAAFGLSNTPGYFKATETQSRTVVGDGTIILPDEDGNALPPVPVLMISVSRTITDSIFLGGMPAPPALLTAFGLTQGIVNASNFVLFYPLSNINLPVAGYNLDAGGNLVFFSYRPDEVRNALGIGLAENLSRPLQVFPNPVQRGETLKVTPLEAQETTSYTIRNLSGQIVQAGECSVLNPTIELKQGIDSGIYLLSLIDNKGQLVQATKLQVL